MASREEIIRELARLFKDRGFQGKGAHWSLPFAELRWLVYSERLPRTTRVGMYVGVDIGALGDDPPPKNANYCAVVLHPDIGGEPFGLEKRDTREALDEASRWSDEERTGQLSAIFNAIAALATQTSTVAALRELAAAGRLRAALRRDARAFLGQ